MNIVVEKELFLDDYILNVGDIVFDNMGYLIVKKDVNGFILYSLTKTFGLTGYHKTLESLTESIKGKGYKIFKESEYELVIRRKAEKGD